MHDGYAVTKFATAALMKQKTLWCMWDTLFQPMVVTAKLWEVDVLSQYSDQAAGYGVKGVIPSRKQGISSSLQHPDQLCGLSNVLSGGPGETYHGGRMARA